MPPEPDDVAEVEQVVTGPVVDSPFPPVPPTVDDEGRISRPAG